MPQPLKHLSGELYQSSIPLFLLTADLSVVVSPDAKQSLIYIKPHFLQQILPQILNLPF